jgi:hypothetical protein
MVLNGAVFLLCLFFFEESRVLFLAFSLFHPLIRLISLYRRADVILAKRCKRLEAETGRPHYIEGGERFESWKQALAVSVKRPLWYLCTEPIVAALSLYAGLSWYVLVSFRPFLLLLTESAMAGVPSSFSSAPSRTSSVRLPFPFSYTVTHHLLCAEKTYGFSQGQAGTVLICGAIGGAISCVLVNIFQERIYQRKLVEGHGKVKPEVRRLLLPFFLDETQLLPVQVRLYPACIGGLLFAGGLFGFAGCARESVHWIVPCLWICIFEVRLFHAFPLTLPPLITVCLSTTDRHLHHLSLQYASSFPPPLPPRLILLPPLFFLPFMTSSFVSPSQPT